MWLLGVKLRLFCIGDRHLYLLSHLTGPTQAEFLSPLGRNEKDLPFKEGLPESTAPCTVVSSIQSKAKAAASFLQRCRYYGKQTVIRF